MFTPRDERAQAHDDCQNLPVPQVALGRSELIRSRSPSPAMIYTDQPPVRVLAGTSPPLGSPRRTPTISLPPGRNCLTIQHSHSEANRRH